MTEPKSELKTETQPQLKTKSKSKLKKNKGAGKKSRKLAEANTQNKSTALSARSDSPQMPAQSQADTRAQASTQARTQVEARNPVHNPFQDPYSEPAGESATPNPVPTAAPASQSTPTPVENSSESTPAPSSRPAPESSPQATPEPTATAQPSAAPAPMNETAAVYVPTPTPAPAPTLAPSPSPSAAPVTTTSISTPTPVPTSTPTPTPKPTPTPTPTPTPSCVTSGSNLPAVNVQIDVGGYKRPYRVSNRDQVVGNSSYSLAPGTYPFSNNTGSFNFTVDSCGKVASLNTSAATASGNTLTLRSIGVSIYAGAFNRTYSVNKGSPVQGDTQERIITGIQDSLKNASGSNIFVFTVSTDGSITPVSGGESVRLARQSITFKTAELTVDPGRFTRSYSLQGGSAVTGLKKFVAIANAPDRINNKAGQEITQFAISESGAITALSGAASITTSNGTIAFKTADVEIDAGAFTRGYVPLGATTVSGSTHLVTIANAPERLLTSSGATIADFAVASDGTIQVLSGQESVMPSSAKLAFKTVAFTVDPGSFTRTYVPSGGAGVSGVQRLIGIANAPDRLANKAGSEIAQFKVSDSGEVSILSGASSVTASSGKVSFRTVRIQIDPGAFSRNYVALGGAAIQGPSETIAIVNAPDRLTNGAGQPIADFRAAEDASITIDGRSSSVDLSPGKISFKTVSLTVDPGQFARAYVPTGGPSQIGASTLVSVANAPDRINSKAGTQIVDFTAASDGTLSLAPDTQSASADVGKLTFKTVELSIDPGAYARAYTPTGGNSVSGPSQLVAIVSAADQIINKAGKEIVQFSAAADGTIKTQGSANSVIVGSHSIAFRNARLDVDPGNYPGSYKLAGGNSKGGPASEVVVPNTTDLFSAGDTNKLITVQESLVAGDSDNAVSISSGSSTYSIQFALTPLR